MASSSASVLALFSADCNDAAYCLNAIWLYQYVVSF